jgi:hypothetical protein
MHFSVITYQLTQLRLAKVLTVNRDADDSVVEFADRVHKINKRNKMQVRWLVITGQLC